MSDWLTGFVTGASAPVDVGDELQRSGMRLIHKPNKISHKNLNLYYIRPLAERQLSAPEQLPVPSLCQTRCSLRTEPLTCTQSSLISLPGPPGISSPPSVASRVLNTQWGAECADDPAGQPPGGGKVLATVCRCPSSDLSCDGQVLIVWTTCFYYLRVKVKRWPWTGRLFFIITFSF